MCDETNNQGLTEDWSITRRTLMAAGVAMAGMATAGFMEGAAMERDVTVTTADGVADCALFAPEGEGQWPAVLIWPDILSLRPVFRAMGKRLAAAGHVVLVPNMFYRSAKAPVVEGAFDFGNPEARGRLFAMRKAMSDAGIDSDARAYLAFLDAQPQTDTAKRAGVQGYCMGGPLAFRTAAALPDRIGAVASFHGGGLVAEGPESPHRLIAKGAASYLVAIAQNDDAKEPDAKDTLKAAFAEAQRPATVEVYPADHGWCVPGGPAYNEAAAEKAWAELLKLYGAALV